MFLKSITIYEASFVLIHCTLHLFLSLSVSPCHRVTLSLSFHRSLALSLFLLLLTDSSFFNFSYIKFHPRLSTTEYIERLPFALSPSSFHHTDFPFQLVAHSSPLHSLSGSGGVGTDSDERVGRRWTKILSVSATGYQPIRVQQEQCPLRGRATRRLAFPKRTRQRGWQRDEIKIRSIVFNNLPIAPAGVSH